MLNIPTKAPSDNLYIFLTLISITTAVYCNWEIKTLNFESYKFLSEKILEEENSVFELQKTLVSIDSTSLKRYLDNKEYIRNYNSTYIDSLFNIHKQHLAAFNDIDLVGERIKFLSKISDAACIIGFCSLLLWYLLFQRFQDKLLHLQVKKAEEEIENKKK